MSLIRELRQRLRRRHAVLAGSAAASSLLFEGGAPETPFAAVAPTVNGMICALRALSPLAAPANAQAAGDPAVTGQWSAVQSWPFRPGHAHLAPSGKVVAWSTFDSGDNPHSWDPPTGAITALTKAGFNIFCTGHALLGDGRLFVAGGHRVINADTGLFGGLRLAKIYNHASNTWAPVPDMNAGRWYPTATTLPNGDVLVASGLDEAGNTMNNVPQVWQHETNTWRTLSGAERDVGFYPMLYVLASGRVFYAGPYREAAYLDAAGAGAWTDAPPNDFGFLGPLGVSSVMYGDGKVLLLGGGPWEAPATAAAQVINLNDANPAWRYVASMRWPRRNHNSTLLPDGSVLVTGGCSGTGQDNAQSPVPAAELWNPQTEAWTTLATAAVYRGYHSIALLLPDGRVLTGGGEAALDAGHNAEIFSPPYLFKGSRPTISSAPTSISYRQTFAVGTPQAASISQVTWLRLGSVTHSFDMDQRFQRLAFTRASNTLNVTAPAGGRLAPPGYYMLFIVDNNGVPSVAKIIQLARPAVPSNLTLAVASRSLINLQWIDNGDPAAPAPPGTGPRLSVSPGSAAPGGQVTVTWSGIASPTPTDWIALYAGSGAASGSYVEWEYVSCSQTPGASAAAGSCPFRLPAGLAPGTYEFRLFAQDDYLRLATSGPLTVAAATAPTAGFKIERSTGSGAFSQIAVVAKGVIGYADTGLTGSTTYRYRVRAFNTFGDSPFSNTAQATTPA